MCDVCKRKRIKCNGARAGCMRPLAAAVPALATPSGHDSTRKRATVARFTYGEDHSTNSQANAKKRARGTCRQRGDASVTKCKTLEGNGAGSAGKLVANMASFLSPAAKVNTEQRPSKTATKAAKATGKMCLSDFFKNPSTGQVAAKVVSSAVRIQRAAQDRQAQEQARQLASDLKDNEKKRGGNYLSTGASKKLKQMLSKSHTISECKGMIDTPRPVKQKRME